MFGDDSDNDQHREAGRLAHRQAEGVHVGRQVRLCLRDAVLDVHLIDVRVRLDVERDVSCIVPSFEFVDCMYSMLSTPFICCSSGVATACSIVTASAPMYFAVTMICGGMMSGNCAIGSARIATRPAKHGDDGDDDGDDRTTDEEARHGSGYLSGLAPAARTASAFTMLPSARRSAFHHDAVARLRAPCSTIQPLPTRSPTFTVRVAILVVRTDDANLIRALHLGHRALRDDAVAFSTVLVSARTRPYWPGRSVCSGFGNVALMRMVPVLGSISRSAARNRAASRIYAAVGEHQRQAGRAFPGLAGVARTVDAAGDAQILLLAQREIRLDRIDLRHRREQRRRADQIADLGRRDGGDAGR